MNNTLFLFILLLLLPDPAGAASFETAGAFLSGLRLVFGMAVVIGIMLLFHRLNGKGFRFLEKRSPAGIKVKEMRPVGGRKSLCLVEVRGEEILLGLGNDRIDFLFHFGSARPDTRFENALREAGAEE